jgi:small subunit ribosomal protein S21
LFFIQICRGHPPGFSCGPRTERPRAGSTIRKDTVLQILVRDNNVDQAMKVLKKKLQREGVFRELKRQRFYEKPSERKAREKGEAIRRNRKLARKRAVREGLLPAPTLKPRTGPTRPPRF